MAFPADPLDILVRLFINGAWVDVTENVRNSGDIIITNRGQTNEASRVQPSQCNLTFTSADGKYSDRNPNSPYYQLLGRNTPIQIQAGSETDSYLALMGRYPSYASTPDSAALDITGDIDIRADIHPDLWTGDTLGHAIAGKWASTSDERSWVFRLHKDGLLQFAWSTDGTIANSFNVNSSTAVPVTSGRCTVRVTVDVNNGSGNHAITFYTSDSVAGSWTQLGTAQVGGGTTSVYASTAQVEVGSGDTGIGVFSTDNPFNGRIYRLQVRDGIAGTIRLDANFTGADPGDRTISDGTNTITLQDRAFIENDSYRFTGEIPKWPVRWDTTGRDITVPITASGPLRRLAQSKTLHSPIYRRFTSFSTLVGYWPLEDALGSQRAAAATSNTRSAGVRSVSFGSASDLLGSQDVLSFTSTSSRMGAGFPLHSGGTAWTFFFAIRLAATPAGDTPLITLSTSGTGNVWTLKATTLGYDWSVLNGDGTSVDSTTFTYGTDAEPDQWTFHALEVEQSGGNVAWNHRWYAQDSGVSWSTGAQSFAGTIGRMSAWNATANANNDDASYGHIGGVTEVDLMFDTTNLAAINGHRDEKAADRIERLCNEEGISLILKGDTFYSPPMGRQTTDTFLNLVQEAVEVDQGVLSESRSRLGLTYTMRYLMQNVRPAAILSYSSGHLADEFNPVEDDQNLANLITVTRKGGSSHTTELTTGRLSTADVGVYEKPFTANVADDVDLLDQGGWRRHLGTWDEERYSKIAVWLQRPQLVADAGLSARVLALDCASRLQITDTPDWQPARDVDVIVRSYREVIKNRGLELEFNTSPYGPYNVAVIGWEDYPGTSSVIGSTSSVLAGGIGDDDTGIVVTSECGWDTGITDLDIEVGGERLTITEVADWEILNGNPFFETDTSDWTGFSGLTISRSSEQAHEGTYSMKCVPDGTSSTVYAESDLVAAEAASDYRARGWLYVSGAAASGIGVLVNWFDSGFNYLSTDGTILVPSVGEWIEWDETHTAPANTEWATIVVSYGGTPPASAIMYADQVMLMAETDGLSQLFTVTRSVNGVVKGHSVDTQVRLWNRTFIGF